MSDQPENSVSADSSYTAAGRHTTAAAVGKRYVHDFAAPADGPDQASRTVDGHLSSGEHLRQCLDRLNESQGNAASRLLSLEFHHPLENYLRRRWACRLLGRLAKCDRNNVSTLERIVSSYRDPSSSLWQRIKYYLPHKFMDRMRGSTDVETFRRRLAGHRPTVRGLVIVAESLARFGLTTPQRFTAPLFAVWNFTNRCNLSCKHCYQDSEHLPLDDELDLRQKLDLVDQMGRAHMPMLAVSGGEPTISPHLLPVLERAAGYGMHLTVATNGTTMTPELAARLAGAGLRYVEISLDSVDPARHDAFRGVSGMWKRAVAGAKAVAATPGLRLGIAMCVHRGNYDEVEAMIDFAKSLGAGCFAHFNFIPVGRGLKMVHGDITPRQRQRLLDMLSRKMREGGIGVISTAPQLGRVCLAGPLDGKMACSHAGSGSGAKARVVAKYLGGCGAGRTYVCIEPNGNVTPCVYLPHRVMGNVRQKPLMDVFRSSVFWDVLNDRDRRLHHCRVCAFRQYCGGCRARADAYYGQLHAGDPGCVFNDKHWEALVEEGIAVMDDAAGAAEMTISATRHGPA